MSAESTSPIRVAVLNDYAIVVEGIASIFEARPERFEVVYRSGTSEHDEDDLADLTGRGVDVVLYDPFASREAMDVRVPRGLADGERKYVVLSWFRSASSVAQALELGFAGYLSKTLDDDALADAVETIHRGENPPQDTRWPGPSPTGRWPGMEVGLTPRESEVLCLVAQGLTNLEISTRAHIGAESIKSHIRSAYRKIGVARRSQAIVWCLSHGFAPTPRHPSS